MRVRSREDGKINLLALLMLATFLGGVYSLVFYLPPWSRNRKVVGAMHEAAYRAWQDDDARVRTQIRMKTDPVWVVQDGNTVRPLIDDETIQISRETDKIHIEIAYTVLAKLPFTDEWREVTFDNEVSTGLENPRLQKPKKDGFWGFLGLEQ
jgi:hypothetical protein